MLVNRPNQQDEDVDLDAQDWEELADTKNYEDSIAVDAFVKIDGIDGESTDDKHKNEIEVHRWVGRVENTGSAHTGGGMGSSKCYHYDFKFAKLLDKASPKLHAACSSGEHIKKAVLTIRKAGKEQQEFCKLTFSDVLVSGYKQFHDPDPKSGLPRDGFSFNYGKLEIEYKPQNSDGTLGGAVKGGWDVKKNQVP